MQVVNNILFCFVFCVFILIENWQEYETQIRLSIRFISYETHCMHISNTKLTYIHVIECGRSDRMSSAYWRVKCVYSLSSIKDQIKKEKLNLIQMHFSKNFTICTSTFQTSSIFILVALRQIK